MNSHEELRRYILESQRSNPSGNIHHRLLELAAKFGLQETDVRGILEEMANNQLISLAALVDGKERKAEDWLDTETFFDYVLMGGGGYVIVSVLQRGNELLSEMPKAPLGFSPS